MTSTSTEAARDLEPSSSPPATAGSAASWRRLALLCTVVLLANAVVMLVWVTVLWDRAQLAHDAALNLQAIWLIAHGHLSAPVTVDGNDLHGILTDRFALIFWPLALVELLPTHLLGVLYTQGLFLVGAEAVAMVFIWRIVRRATYLSTRSAQALVLCGLVLSVTNPWTLTTVANDLHPHAYAGLFLVLAALWFYEARWWLGTLAAVLCTLSFDVASSYVVGLGLGLVVAAVVVSGDRRRRLALHGLGLAIFGGVWLMVTKALGSGSITGVQDYAYLAAGGTPGSTADLAKGLLTHPSRWLSEIVDRRNNVVASIAPGGGIGGVIPTLVPLTVAVLLPSLITSGVLFSVPGFQQVALDPLIPVGTIAALCFLGRWHRIAERRRQPLLVGLALALSLNAVAWAVVWDSHLAQNWLRVPTATAADVHQLVGAIPVGDEVVASQGVVGNFAGRPQLYTFGQTVPLTTPVVYFVVAPQVGLETNPVDATMTAIDHLVTSYGAQVTHLANGLVVLRLVRPAGVDQVDTSNWGTTIPAWLAVGPGGAVVRTGSTAAWRVVPSGRAGYVVSGDYWLRPAGHYLATVRLSAQAPTTVEVWDDRDNTLLARVQSVATGANLELQLPVTAHAAAPSIPPYAGWGPFSITAVQPPPGEVLEIRIEAPTGQGVAIASVSISP